MATEYINANHAFDVALPLRVVRELIQRHCKAAMARVTIERLNTLQRAVSRAERALKAATAGDLWARLWTNRQTIAAARTQLSDAKAALAVWVKSILNYMGV